MPFENLTDSQKIIVIQNSVIEQQSKLERHHKILVEGNGEPPLMYRVKNIETFVDGIRFWQRTIAVAIVLQTITFGAAAIVYFVRLYPLLERLANNP